MSSDNIKWLTSVPATDGNFKCHLKAATAEEIKDALSILKANGEKGCVSKISTLSRELRKRDKEKGEENDNGRNQRETDGRTRGLHSAENEG